jgi:membrane fusion protein (multidrug efflux system)
VKDNQQVKAGDTLAMLDVSDLNLRVRQAEIGLASAQASLHISGFSSKAAEENVTVSNSAIATAQANLDAAQIRVWKSTQDFNRYEKLLALKSATQQQYDNVKADKESAEKMLKVAQMQLTTTKNQSSASNLQASSVGSQVKPAELMIEQKKAELELAKLNLSYAVITAPYNGFVSRKALQVGQLVNIGQTMMYIVDAENIWVVANFKETQTAKFKAGMVAHIEVDAFDGLELEGEVQSIQDGAGSKFSLMPTDNATGNFVKVVQRIPVKILLKSFDKEKYRLSPGMNCDVEVKFN